MRYTIDHDCHIHSYLSSCSKDPAQTPENIIKYARARGISRVCLTDHYWDDAVPGASRWYKPQNFDHIAQYRDLPQADDVAFFFGCETDMDMHGTIGLPASRYDAFDFIIVPTTHLHMKNFTIPEEKLLDSAYRAEQWVWRFDKLLDSDLPMHKVGVAHITSGLINNTAPQAHHETLSRISDEEITRLFAKAAARGCGIELNAADMREIDCEPILRFFRIAKACGCKFYLGSDAHEAADFTETVSLWDHAISVLDLTEDDKFHVGK